jgi:hypothetical protein
LLDLIGHDFFCCLDLICFLLLLPVEKEKKMSVEWFQAAEAGNREVVARLMSEHPEFLNQTSSEEFKTTALHSAVRNGHYEVVSLLLTHPDINVNPLDIFNTTPFCWSLPITCPRQCFKVLIEDDRTTFLGSSTMPLSPTITGHIPNPLKFLIEGAGPLLAFWILSGRHIDSVDFDKRALQNMASENTTAALLNEFLEHPTEVRNRLRTQRGWAAKAARLFALVVFFCDGFMALKEGAVRGNVAQFFFIAERLPLDLQMLLCNRCAGFSSVNISVQQREAGFKLLAQSLLS